jgi:hypothetical protein
MRLSDVIDRVFDAIEDRLQDQDKGMLEFTRGLVRNAMMHYGDLDLNIEIRKVPVEVVDVEGKEEAAEAEQDS